MQKNVRAKKNSKLILAATVEFIEQRLLLSGAVFSGNTLTVTGSSATDAISVYYTEGSAEQNFFNITTTVNGSQQLFTNVPLEKVVINAGDGNNTVTMQGYQSLSTAVTINTGSGNDSIFTSLSADTPAQGVSLTINTGDGTDTVNADFNGSATINGGSGNDSLTAASDTNTELPAYATINGGDGNDTITAGIDGNAFVTAYGQGGNDTFVINDYDDTLAAYGGAGTNTFQLGYYDTAESSKTIALDGRWHGNLLLDGNIQNVIGNYDGNLTVLANATANDDIAIADIEGVISLVGGGGNDTLSAGNSTNPADDGATAFLQGGSGTSLLVPGSGITHFSNGNGTATADFASLTANLQIHLDGSQDSGDPNATAYDYVNNEQATGLFDTFDGNVQNAIGGSGNNLIEGTGTNNILTGGPGNDTLVSNGGTDALFGNGGNDTFEARDGSATYIDGGAGTNVAYTDPSDVTYNVQSRNPDLAAPTQLSGTTIGTSGSYQNHGNTIAKVFDGNVNTYFDAASASGAYVGLDLGTPKVVNQISFAPRAGFESRMVGGVIQGSNSASFTGAVVLYTIDFTPASGALSTVGFNNTTAYRYYRYLGAANSYCNIAELKLFNSAQPYIAEDSSGDLVINGTAGSDVITTTFQTDESLNFDRGPDYKFITETFTVTINGVSESFTNNTITQIIINSGQGNDTINASGFEQYDGVSGGNVLPFPYINLQINAGDGNDVISTNVGHDQSYAYQSADSVSVLVGNGNNEIELQGGYSQSVTAGNGNDTISCGATDGTSIGEVYAGNGTDSFTAGSAGDGGEQLSARAGGGQDTLYNSDYEDDASFQGNDGEYFDIPYSTNGQYADIAGQVNVAYAQVYLDNNNDGVYDAGDTLVKANAFGIYEFTNLVPAQPQSTYNIRIIPPLGYDVTSPSNGLFTISTAAGYGYSGIDFTLKSSQLSGTVIGTAGSYRNQGNTTANAFDGNLSTFFDAPTASGSWVGLDLGSAQIVTQISYAPRPGWAARMVGGMFQGSNSPDFSSGNETLYTVTSTPQAGALTTVQVTNWSAYQYVRYIGPANSYCNIAEVAFFGTLPATGATLEPDGTLVVDGSQNADMIHVRINSDDSTAPDTVVATINGNSQTFPLASVLTIVVNPGAGNDSISLDGYDEGPQDASGHGYESITLNGGSGDDLVSTDVLVDGFSTTNNENLLVVAGSGNDSFMIGNNGYVTLVGGTGNDTFNSNGNPNGLSEDVYGGSGAITIDADGDTVYPVISGGTGGVILNYAYNGFSSLSPPVINLNAYVNVHNVILGGEDAATVIGTAGNDTITDLNAGANNISVLGGGGNDVITIDGGNDVVVNDAGPGASTINVHDSSDVTVTGGNGNDMINVRGDDIGPGAKPSFVDGGGGYNTAYTDPGDTITNIQNLNPDELKILGGAAIGTPGSYRNQGNTVANVFDGNIDTFFDGPDATGDWVGLDLGVPQVVSEVQYAPRSGWTSRMVGGQIQASNSVNFSTGVVTLYTISAAPPSGVTTTALLTHSTAYRYYRYLGPSNSYCNIAELKFVG
jgi:hypothetical protein